MLSRGRHADGGLITTLEYDVIRTDHPKIETITPENLRQAFLKGKAPTFDAMVWSYSSLEHSTVSYFQQYLKLDESAHSSQWTEFVCLG